MIVLPEPPASRASFINQPFTAAAIWRCFKMLLARNPFYILSALLLLYSIRLLSVDSRLFRDETPNLLFNFSSFQFYELLLAGTAILLARRMIWYDSGLLIGVETMFVFVPFILVSQALLISNGFAFAFCAAACVLTVGRTLGLKRWLPKAYMPVAQMIAGAIVLCTNVAQPILTRLLHKDVSFAIWDVRGSVLQAIEWYGLMPVLVAMAMVLPASSIVDASKDGALYTRRFFPSFALSLWVAGTGAHLYCIGFVYGQHWNDRLWLPAVWTSAWMLWLRRQDLDFVPERTGRAAAGILLAGPAAVVLLAECVAWRDAVWLAALTLLVYGGIAMAKRQWLPLHLAFVSLALLAGALPDAVSMPKPLAFHSLELAAMVAGGYFMLITLLSRQPFMGLAGGIMLSILGFLAGPAYGVNGYLAIDIGLVYALLHSLHWEGGVNVRRCIAAGWLAQCLCWMLFDNTDVGRGAFASGLSIIIVYFCARAVTGRWASRLIPWTASAAMTLAPIRLACLQCEHAPDGVLMLGAVFFYLGLARLRR